VSLPSFFFKSKSPPPLAPPPLSPAAVIERQINEMAKHSTLLGHVRRIFAKFRISPKKAKLILLGIAHAIHWEELLFFAFMGWLFVPLLEMPQTLVRNRFFPKARPFKKSYTHLVADHVAQLSRIGFIVYITDIIKILLRTLGFKFPQLGDAPHIVAKLSVRRPWTRTNVHLIIATTKQSDYTNDTSLWTY
jgi:hypothetical protein